MTFRCRLGVRVTLVHLILGTRAALGTQAAPIRTAEARGPPGYSRRSRFQAMTTAPRAASSRTCQIQRASRRRAGVAAWKASQR